MGKRIDLTGVTINGIYVESFAYTGSGKSKKAHWNCICHCGNRFIAESEHLRTGHTRSCGCYKREQLRDRVTKHGATANYKKDRLYTIWRDMRKRCRNPNTTSSKNYVDRGIKVCEMWDNSYLVFRDWALANGYNDTLTIERINNDGNYCPENCKWIPRSKQNQNKRNTRYIEYKGVNKPFVVWCDELGLSKSKIGNRIYTLGWPVNKAFETP